MTQSRALKNIWQKIVDRTFLMGSVANLLWQSIIGSCTRPFYYHRLTDQIVNLGIGSISITVVIGFVMGSVMTLQFGYGLAKFGGTLYVPAIVSLSLFREMAPIFTSLLVAGRIGSGIAAEVGSMNVTQQVDALRALGTSPIRTLVVPRLLAAIIALPLLTALSDALGLLGGMLVSVSEFGMTPGFYFNKVFSSVKIADFLSGLVKSGFFGMLIVVIACYKGLNTSDGTRGVGLSTTWVVVQSSIWILLSDFVLSKIFLIFWMD